MGECRRKMMDDTHTEAEFECKHCGETTDELVTETCDESSLGFHTWKHTDPSKTAGTDTTVVNKTPETDETGEGDDWKTMNADECKRQAGLTQVEGVVWENTRD